tara:strand:- start:423 stop:614 length:192 start_codon:yes stop_codon:yes gene_type:complete
MEYNYDHLKEKQPTGLIKEMVDEVRSNEDFTVHELQWSEKQAFVELTSPEHNKKYKFTIEEID